MLADDLLNGTPHDEGAAVRGLRPRKKGPAPAARWVVVALTAATVVAVVLGLAVAPLAVLVVAGLVLTAAIFWRSGAARSAGASVVPRVAVWTAVVALLLAIGSASVQGFVGSWTATLAGTAPRDVAPHAEAGLPARGESPPSSAASAPVGSAPASSSASPTASVQMSASAQPPVTPEPAVPQQGAALLQATVKPQPTAAALGALPSPTPTYRNCGALRALGIQTLLRGQPGYTPRLDRNGDGIACN